MTNTCEKCKWWNKGADFRKQDSGPKNDNYGYCESKKFTSGYYSDQEDNMDDVIGLDGVLLESDEGWCMVTGKDFGCIHWSGKSLQ